MKLRKPRPAKPGEINYPMLDRFTFAHLAIGCVYSFLGFDFILVGLLAIGWELIENPIKANMPWMFPHGTSDTLQNAIGDVLAVLVGWGATQYLRY